MAFSSGPEDQSMDFARLSVIARAGITKLFVKNNQTGLARKYISGSRLGFWYIKLITLSYNVSKDQFKQSNIDALVIFKIMNRLRIIRRSQENMQSQK